MNAINQLEEEQLDELQLELHEEEQLEEQLELEHEEQHELMLGVFQLGFDNVGLYFKATLLKLFVKLLKSSALILLSPASVNLSPE